MPRRIHQVSPFPEGVHVVLSASHILEDHPDLQMDNLPPAIQPAIQEYVRTQQERRHLVNPSQNRRFVPPRRDIQPFELYSVAPNRCSFVAPRYLNGRSMLLFTDGACLDNGRTDRVPRAGFGFVFRPSEPGVHGGVSAALEHSPNRPTNNRAELRAAIGALQFRAWQGEGCDEIVIATDSEYLVLGICDRLVRWMERGWRTANGNPVANRDLWEILIRRVEYLEGFQVAVKFWLIPREWNTEADGLAKEGALQSVPDQFTEISGVLC